MILRLMKVVNVNMVTVMMTAMMGMRVKTMIVTETTIRIMMKTI